VSVNQAATRYSLNRFLRGALSSGLRALLSGRPWGGQDVEKGIVRRAVDLDKALKIDSSIRHIGFAEEYRTGVDQALDR